MQAAANARAVALAPEIAEIRASGVTTVRGLADALTERGIATPRNNRWHVTGVRLAEMSRRHLRARHARSLRRVLNIIGR